ncbi:stage II sporulation protein D [Paenibacillus crassostreae]|uniref:Stage II sporulation protein D n=1 Tax=Paenibacillus crassostreae TaxID=1763538 RepID=A0A162RH18_9BACL|nr:stage II sporulation protein D [Paenibacillus crassostreae]AOZ93212.1 stage II sporulation protein D [Paenibacillus crassostreae]OAB71697.1 stage II sporulation protein D [Paenibacillus crassostreae]
MRELIHQMNISMKRFKVVPWRRTALRRNFFPVIWAIGGLLMMALLIPILVVSLHPNPTSTSQPPLTEVTVDQASPILTTVTENEEPEIMVSVYLSENEQIETLPLEEYVIGVIAAEMPADFAFDAIKAQAIAARTYIARRLLNDDKSGVPVQGADVTDTISHQAYISKENLEHEWSNQGKASKLTTIRRAVQESRNMIMTYDGEPITATFFSTSNGYTENSEDYWEETIPYLRSVSSPWDKQIAPHYKETIKISKKQFAKQMGLSADNSLIQILSMTEGHRIKEINIGGVTFSGRSVREMLGLRSSEFTWEDSGEDIAITTYGNGHGVGMSQWGANGMAQAGYTATQILRHYYTGIDFEEVTKLLSKK